MVDLKTLLQATKSALIVVDVQNEFCHPEGTFARKGMDVTVAHRIMEPLRRLIDGAHGGGIPVIYIKNIEDEFTDTPAWVMRPDGAEDSPNQEVTRRGSWGAEFYGLTPREGDAVVEKHRFSAFLNTRLETVLKTLGVQTLVFAGLTTNVCVATSATHAVMLGYHVVLAEDACAAWLPGAHETAVTNIRLFVGKVADSATIAAHWNCAVSE